MNAATVVRELWTRAQARDWDGFGELVAEDAVIEWPVSSERIVGRALICPLPHQSGNSHSEA